MTSGIIGIEFESTATEEQIQHIIDTIYKTNAESIKGMRYLEFENQTDVGKILQFAEKLE